MPSNVLQANRLTKSREYDEINQMKRNTYTPISAEVNGKSISNMRTKTRSAQEKRAELDKIHYPL